MMVEPQAVDKDSGSQLEAILLGRISLVEITDLTAILEM
jgi:hypothetical protein